MAVFEISSKKRKDGKRKFTARLYKLQPPECVVNNVGIDGHWNENGITFIEEYASQQLDSIKDMSLTCDFLDIEHTEVSGHGETNEFTADGLPIFDASIVGHFTEGYISDFTDDDGTTQRAVFGTGFIDEMRSPNFVAKLDENIANGIYPSGSIEIIRPVDSETIEYLNGKFEEGRVPVSYLHSGFSIVLNAADKSAKLLELNTINNKNNNNNEREEKKMDEKTLGLIVDSVKNTITEVNSKNTEYENQISELNSTVESKDAQIVELNASIEELQKALADIKAEQETWWAERDIIEKELAEMRVAKRLSELNTALADFTDEQKDYAKAEIEAFNADPMAVEINSITDKIYAEMGKKAMADAKEQKASEINSKNDETVDIYGEVCSVDSENTEEFSLY